MPGSPAARASTTLPPLTQNQQKKANKKKNLLAEVAKLEALPDDEKDLEENRQRQETRKRDSMSKLTDATYSAKLRRKGRRKKEKRDLEKTSQQEKDRRKRRK